MSTRDTSALGVEARPPSRWLLSVRRWPAANLVMAILGAGCLITVVLNWPGHIGYDSLIQLTEGRTGVYENWHPALMSWILGVFDWLLPGAGLFVVFNAVLLYASFAVIAIVAPAPRSRLAIAVAAFCLVTPQCLIYPAIVWKDVLFSGFALAAFASIALADRVWDRRTARFALAATALLFSALAALTRQNGAIVPIGVSVALALVVAQHQPSPLRLRKVVAYAAVAAFVAGALALSGLALLSIRVNANAATSAQLRYLQFYDITGAVAQDPTLPLDDIHQFDPAVERAIRSDGVRLYSPQNNDSVTDWPAFANVLDHPTSPMIPRQWLHLVAQHPLLYLQVRSRVFRWTFSPPDIAICVPVELGVTTDLPDLSKALGLTMRWDRRDRALETYVANVDRTPILSHVTYFLLAVGALAFLLWRRTSTDLVISAMLVSALAFVASFFVISIACDYRYLLFLDLAALAAGFHIALTFRHPRARGDGGHPA